MAHRVQFLNKLSLIILLVAGCKSPETKTIASTILLNKNEPGLQMVNGLLMKNNKLFSGTIYSLYPGTTDTAALASYLDGKEHGEWKKFYSSKHLQELRFFDQGNKIGEYQAWWENGNRQLDYFFTEDEYEGTCKEWNEEGKLTKIMNYKKGHEEGHQQWWYDNGKIKANYIIKDGRRYGLLGTKNCVNVSDSVFKK